MKKHNFDAALVTPNGAVNMAEYRDFLLNSENNTARGLLGRVSTCMDYQDGIRIHYDIESASDSKSITEDEFKALNTLLNFVMTQCHLAPTLPKNPNKDVRSLDLTEHFKKRIWSMSDVSRVMQFRNAVTDMLMLEFIELDEYIELSNEIDRYIQYTLSNGTK